MDTCFEWDQVKADRNFRKHCINFETALRAFADPFALTEQNRIEHGERHWQTLGIVDGHLLLLVAHTVLDDVDGAEVIRITSARRADPKERKRCEQNCAF